MIRKTMKCHGILRGKKMLGNYQENNEMLGNSQENNGIFWNSQENKQNVREFIGTQ